MFIFRSNFYSFRYRRRKLNHMILFLFAFTLLIWLFSNKLFEFDSFENENFSSKKSFSWQINQSDLRKNSILAKYLDDPYNIDIQAIINESNQKYYHFNRNPLTENARYLVYSCRFMCGGWGDRTRKIVAAFLLSLSLNRTFIIDMTWPCSIESILSSNWIPWSISFHSHLRNSSLSSINLTTNILKTYQDLKIFHQNYSILFIQTTNIAYFDFISQQIDLYQSLWTRFRLKRKHIHIITVYSLFYELLIKLKPHLEEKLKRFNLTRYQSEMNEDKLPLLCGHLRIGRNPSNPKDMIFPNRELMNITVLNFLEQRPGQIFITTDSIEVQQLARKMFFINNDKHKQSRLIEINGTIAHIDRDWNYLGCQSLEKTILDFHALALCDLAVISKSSFGHLAIMRRDKPYKDLYLYCRGIKRVRFADDYNKYKYATC